jgi:hypothetical protein
MSRTRIALGLVLSIGLALAACQQESGSSAKTTTTSTTSTSSTTTTVPAETWYVCDGTPAQCLKLAAGWALVGKVIDEPLFGNVSAVSLPSGGIRIYGEYESNPLGPWNPRIMSYVSDNGSQFALESGVRVSEGRMPSVIRLSDGRYRMYLEDTVPTEASFWSAISSDGLNFTLEPGNRLKTTDTGNESIGFTSPRVAALKDGRYRMYYGGQNSKGDCLLLSAISTDGLIWTREEGIRINAKSFCSDWAGSLLSGPVIDANGTVRLYWGFLKCDSQGKNDHFGIFEFTSSDGLAFTQDPTLVVEGYYIQSKFKGSGFDPHLFPTAAFGVITPGGLSLYFQLSEMPVTGAPIAEQGLYCVRNPNIK